jgi:hypothetical protein
VTCETASSRSRSCRSSGPILSGCKVDAVVGVNVGRVSGVLVVDAAFAVCAGISNFPSVCAGLGRSSSGRASRGATCSQMVSLKPGIYGMRINFHEGGISSTRAMLVLSYIVESRHVCVPMVLENRIEGTLVQLPWEK